MALDGKVTSGFEFTTGSTYLNVNIFSSGIGVFKSSAKVHDSYWLLLVLYKFHISICYCLWNRTGLHGQQKTSIRDAYRLVRGFSVKVEMSIPMI